MAVSRVDLKSGETLIDLTRDNVNEGSLVVGHTAHGADGEIIEGTNPYELASTNATVDTQKSLIFQIKAALANKAAGGGTALPTQEKTVEITENGTVEVLPDDGYALHRVGVSVNVPVPDGYIQPSGTLAITQNGEHNAREYEKVSVNVPIPDGYIKPSGILDVTENGTHNVSEYASVNVQVSGEDVTAETNAYTEKLASLEIAIAALEAELEGKASGGSAQYKTCTIEIVNDTGFIDVVSYRFTCVIDGKLQYITQDSHVFDGKRVIMDVLCGSIFVLWTDSMSGGYEIGDNIESVNDYDAFVAPSEENAVGIMEFVMFAGGN